MTDMYLATKADFDQCLKDAGDKVVCIDFTATWCPPCKKIAPIYEEMAKEFTNCVLKKVDVDANAETSQHCGIACMPTFKFFKGGNELTDDKIEGANENKIREVLGKHNAA